MKLCKKIYKKFIITAIVLTLPILTACNSQQNSTSNNSGNTVLDEETETATASPPIAIIPELRDADDAKVVDIKDSEYTGKLTLNGSSVSVSGKNISSNGATATITAGGTYYLTGNLTEGQIIIDATDNKKVTLVFDNIEISNSTLPCIHALNTKKLYIVLKDNSVNTINCTALLDGETAEEDAAFYSKEDLVLKGNGKLKITSASNGITSKDSLEMYGGTYEITAGNNGLKGKDNVYIENSDITITAENDGIKSTNADDMTLGYIAIASGHINITASGDGIQAETRAFISGGSFSIISGGGSANATKTSHGQQFNPFGGQIGGTTQATDETSCKGIKAGVDITINAGTININSADDALHSNTYMPINGGEFTLASGDDGMHSDTLLTINDGTVTITKSYEGIESADIIFNGGNISIMSSDDGGITWVKRQRIDQTVATGQDGIWHRVSCRDPKVFPVKTDENGKTTLWGMVVTGQESNRVWFMKSTNLLDWSYAGQFNVNVPECPDVVTLTADDGEI